MDTKLHEMTTQIRQIIEDSTVISKEFVGNPKHLIMTYETKSGLKIEVHTALDWNDEGEYQPAGCLGYYII